MATLNSSQVIERGHLYAPEKKPLGAVLLIGLLLFQGITYFRSYLVRSKIPIFSRHKGWSASWKDARDYLQNSPGVLREGYEKFSRHGKFYQLRTPVRWIVVAPPKFVDEIRTASVTHLSHQISAEDVQQSRYTISPVVSTDKFHFELIKTHITPKLETKIDDTLDEITRSFNDEIGTSLDFQAHAMSRLAHRIATRVANRLLIGPGLCRNEEYLQMCVAYTVDVFGGADKLRVWPDFLRGVVTPFVTEVKKRQEVARRLLIPYIEDRLASEDKYKADERSEKWDKRKPTDALQLIIEAASNPLERNPQRLMYRVLHLNVAAVHTTSLTFLNCVYDLAYRLQYHEELRNEVIEVTKEAGWTKKGLNAMIKLDSFMLESQRLAPIASSQMTRAAVKDFKFSDGTVVPKGSYILVPMEAMCVDDEFFPNASSFDGFRFARLRAEPGEETRHQFVTTSPSHINFGHGKHACPGRFFAGQEVKLLLARLLLEYDFKLENMDQFPPPTWYDRSRRPNHTARVLFKKRV